MVRGQCFCGAVSFEIEGALSAPSLCHCGQCRRLHGAPGAYTSAPVSAYRISGEESLNWYATSKRAEQAFCRICGSKLFWREIGGQDLDACMGSLDAPTGLTLGRHIFTRSQGDYYEIGHDGVPRFAASSAGAEPIGEEMPPQSGPKKTEHSGGCQCGAVGYRVSGSMRDVVVCHCGQCQRIHGYAPGYSAAREAELIIEGEENLAWYRTSDRARRGFCRSCGSSLFWNPDDRDTVSITAGSLQPPTGLKTVLHIMVADKRDYYTIADGVPQVPGSSAANPITF
ncbi:GFA family protein [Dongia sedimenti]|uniref:GFA family protein n=1 Tax=Dongia sedimenti TaxID=3064282 RepID=A0ABU0YJJ7_9PROT|nr:GFA family protein [Rhodospirillaceae bacterium R-7]